MTRIAVLCDIHGNLPALEAVIRDAGDCDLWWSGGDTVGYGPYPNRCVYRMQDLEAESVLGNHDLGSLGEISLDDFNPVARTACEWTGRNLDERAREIIESLEMVERPLSGVMLVHGSPREPVWEYILSRDEALSNFGSFDERICFHGHSHAPAVFTLTGRGEVDLTIPEDGTRIDVESDKRYLVNVGSVGQPRDGDPRACYAVFQPGEGVIRYRRVEYDIQKAQSRMEERGLPRFLIERLSVGR